MLLHKISGFNENFYCYNKKLITLNLIPIDFYLFFPLAWQQYKSGDKQAGTAVNGGQKQEVDYQSISC